MQAKAEASSNPDYKDLVYINGYDDAEVIAGAGTIGLEIIDQCPDVDAVVIPCGGGGLLAGIGTAPIIPIWLAICFLFRVPTKHIAIILIII